MRYNWIESGNRQLDLVEGEDSVLIRNAPEYRKTFVYGNILIEPDGAGNSQITHYGGDSGTTSTIAKARFIFTTTQSFQRDGNTTLFRLSTNEETAMRETIFFTLRQTAANLAMIDDTGILSISQIG